MLASDKPFHLKLNNKNLNKENSQNSSTLKPTDDYLSLLNIADLDRTSISKVGLQNILLLVIRSVL